MQRATITGIRVRSPADARTIFHAVYSNVLPMVTRRLDTEERGLIAPGSVYVWEERGPHAELTGVGIERWTDGIRWGPSRVREGFLFYHEKTSQQPYSGTFSNSASFDSSRSVLIKQTYTVYVDTPGGRRKWHLIAYFTEDTMNQLKTVYDIPQLAALVVPHINYRSARSAKGRPDHIFNIEYVPYNPVVSLPTPSPELEANDDEPEPEPMLRRSGPPNLFSSSSSSSSSSSDDNNFGNSSLRNGLVPLSYLQDHPLVRREPTDQILLKKLDAYCRQAGPHTFVRTRFAS